MSDLALTEEQLEFQKLAREFAENEIAPKAHECDQKSKLPLDVLKQAWELGLSTAMVPDDFGGLGLPLLEGCVIAEELAAGCSGIYGAIEANTFAQLILLELASEEQKKKYLQPMTEAPILVGIDAALLSGKGSKVEGFRVKNDHSISGVVTVADAENMEWFLFGVDGGNRMHFYIVPKDAKGVSVGESIGSMGRKALNLTTIQLNNVQVAVSETMEASSTQWSEICDKTNCLLGAAAVGIARSAMQNAIQYSKERKTFGVPISQHQSIGFMLSDMAKDIEAARLLVYRACTTVGVREPGVVSNSVARTFAQDMAMRVATDAVQVYGGYGYSKEYPVEKLMRDAKAYQVFQGSSAEQKIEIGRQLVSAYCPMT